MSNTSSLIISVCTLLAGALIYILFREPVIFTQSILSNCRTPLFGLQPSLSREILLYYIPDGLWCISLMMFASVLSGVLRIAAIMMPLGMEIAQAWHFMPGTFDIIDLTIYLSIILIFLYTWKRKSQNSVR